MLSALVYGPNTLKKVQISDKYTDKKGVEREKKTWVIDQKNQSKEFKIGHSQSISETFLPHFYKDKKENILYCDIAGLQDTGGQLIALVNSFVGKFIFAGAGTVRFLVPLTQSSIESSRGAQIKDVLHTMQNICSEDMGEVIDAIQPVITKCKPSDDDADIDVIRDVIGAQLDQELKNLKN